jgi:RimJ/RimL family protein N-acetyltransferase
MASSTSGLEMVTVRTTLPLRPLSPHATRKPLITERLILRPCTADDLAGLHRLRTQPEVMVWTSVGRVDRDLDETRSKLALSLPPHDADTLNYALCLKATGEMIGIGGSHKMRDSLGWPVIGYMFRKEFWGMGFGTEFVQAFVAAWWELPRVEVEIEVEKATVVVGTAGDGSAVEMLTAITADSNGASQRVLQKCGFSLAKKWEEQDLRNLDDEILLYGFQCPRPKEVGA